MSGSVSSDVQLYKSAEFGSLRVLEEDGFPLFCGSDVAKALGYTHTAKMLSDHCPSAVKRVVPHPQSPSKALEMSFISCEDLAALVKASRKPDASAFLGWVVSEVLAAYGLEARADAGGEDSSDAVSACKDLGIFVQDRRVLVSSRSVARVFGKEHRIVLRDIRSLDCSVEFIENNFVPVAYVDDKGEERPEYLMTRDGFTFLAMGYTGKKAAKFKERYIAAFNAMEAELARMRSQIPDDPTLLGLPDFRVPEIAARAWADEREGRIKAEMERDALREEVEELKPKADFCDKVLAAPNRYPITYIAKDLGISGQALNGILERLGIQYFIGGGGSNRRHGYWAVSSEWQDRGFTHSETFVAKSGRVVSQMHWTETGRAFLLTLFGCGDSSADAIVGTEDGMTSTQRRVALLEARARANLSRLARAPALFATLQLPSFKEETAREEPVMVALGGEA